MGNSKDQARADVCIRSFSTPQIDAFLDIAVISPTCESNVGSNVSSTIKTKETLKRNMYDDRIKKQMEGEFYLVVISSGSMIGNTAKNTIRTIATKLSSKMDEDLKKMKLSIQSDISFSLIRSRINAIRNPKRSIHEQLLSFNST